MMPAKNYVPVLIIDSDRPFLDSLLNDPSAYRYPPTIAKTAEEAISALSTPNRQYSGIFINPKVYPPSGLALIRRAHENHLGTPIYLLYDQDPIFLTPDKLQRLAVHQTLKKPLTFTEITTLVAPLIRSFDFESAAMFQQKSGLENADAELGDSDFIPIRAQCFLSGRRSYFDVYVKIGNSRYLKLLHAGEDFQPERLANYLDRGVTHFYLPKEAQDTYVSYCDFLATALLGQPQIPDPIKQRQVLNVGEETLKYLQDHGVNPMYLNFASRFSNSATQLVKQMKLDQLPAVNTFLDDLVAFEHGAAVTLIAAVLTLSLRIESERIQNMVGVGSLLHDLGLHHHAPHLKHEDVTRMTAEERETYHRHPIVGAHLLHSAPGVSDALIQGIAHHHERRDGKGFPIGISSGRTSLIGEIIGISDEFLQRIIQAQSNPKLNPIEEMKAHVFDGFSCGVVDAFSLAFIKTPQK